MPELVAALPEKDSFPAKVKARIPIRNLWHMFVYAWDLRRFGENWFSGSEAAPSMASLIASVLCDLLERQLRIGLPRGYRPDAANLPYLRGRLVLNSAKAAEILDRGRVPCRFEVFDLATDVNRIIRTTVHRLADRGSPLDEEKDRLLRGKLRALDRLLAPIPKIELSRSLFRRQQFSQGHDLGRLTIALCELLFEIAMPTEEVGRHYSRGALHDEKMLWKIFERFVARFYLFHLSKWGWNVKQQARFHWRVTKVSAGMRSLLPVMRPDLVLHHDSPRRRIIIDTKYSSITAIGEDRETFKSGHLYQMFAYLRGEEAECIGGVLEGILLYPSVGDAVDEYIALPESTLRLATVDLALPWQSIERRLIDLIGVPGEKLH